MKTLSIAIFIFAISACNQKDPTGNLGWSCHLDGTCNSPNLQCVKHDGFTTSFECEVKPVEHPFSGYESERFCNTCADKCGDAGIKSCAFSDVSVWGAKPSLCECK